ncbi:hypothetical protein NRIC_33050 [Enterococcus florum]|uniref:DUF1803 domain-containing protein n=1 Tax=Enterococcus florum TaxID=2480627 RepID=A0A4P5PF94_9ENTE|nr:DUF1803 domain-containing protein [Enterococcus florum]GCF95414.1 hypothetical protein NRIC_33050 [Enterococcus florum]
MKIITTDKKLIKALKEPLVLALLDYFEALETPVILRELRQNFSDYPHLDKNIDLLVDTGVLQRQDRRYQLRLPVLSDFPSSGNTDALLKIISKKELVWFVEAFWQELPSQTIALSFPLAKQTVLENDHCRFVTVNAQDIQSVTLPNYFHFSQEMRPERFKELEYVIGDVDPGFYLNQIELIFERLQAGQAPKKDSIFLKSLWMTQAITEDQPPAILLPVFDSLEISTDKQRTIEELLDKMEASERYFAVHQVVQQLLVSKKAFSYLINKKE